MSSRSHNISSVTGGKWRWLLEERFQCRGGGRKGDLLQQRTLLWWVRKWRSLQDSRRPQEEQGTGLRSRDAGLRERPDVSWNTKSFPVRLEPGPTMLSTSSETPRTKMLRRSRSTKCWTKSRSNTLSDHVGPWSDSMYSFTFWCMFGPDTRGTKHCRKRWSLSYVSPTNPIPVLSRDHFYKLHHSLIFHSISPLIFIYGSKIVFRIFPVN